MQQRTLVDHALDYAARGWFVHPLHNIVNGRCTCGKAGEECTGPGKHPRITGWQNKATTDAATIQGWWKQWPNANIGIATGLSHLCVIDLDVKHNEPSIVNWNRLVAEHIIRETGPEVTTPSKGAHIYFSANGHNLRNTAGKLAAGIDTRADGGYVVAPPSVTDIGEYFWTITPEECNTPQLPESLVTLLIEYAPKSEPVSPGQPSGSSTIIMPDQKQWVVDLLHQPCPQGQRNETLTRLAGYFRNLLPEPVVARLLLDWNATRCTPPLTESEVRQNIRHKFQRYEGIEQQANDTRIWLDTELMATVFPEPTWVLPGILPEGLGVLAGRPKRGKSWLALQIASAVTSGKMTLGRATEARNVIYIALEDAPRRFQSRLKLMGHQANGRLAALHSSPKLDKGGLQFIGELVDKFSPVLLIIDTLSRITGRGRDQDSNADMTDLLDPLQQLALSRAMSILLVDHHRKPGMDANDAIDDIIGSTAKTGVADVIWGLYRKSGESTGSLKITGRDVEEQDLAMIWDGLKFQWRIEGTSEATAMARRLDDLLQVIYETEEVDTRTIATRLRLSEDSVSDAVREAKARGYIKETVVHTGTRGRPRFIYRLTDAGIHRQQEGPEE